MNRSTCLCLPSIGILLLSTLYLIFCVLIRFLAPPCLEDDEEDCQLEGVDNSVIMWGTDFFVAAAAFCFGIHLTLHREVVRKSGTLAHIFMAGSFALMGIARWMYANDATTDNSGILEYWIVSAISSLFLALSAACHAHFALDTASTISKLHRPCCAGSMTRLWLTGVILSCITYLIACIWCSSTPRLHTYDVLDTFADDANFEDLHTCVQLATVSEILLWLFYALLWIPMGILLKAVARRQCQVICGLSTPAAASCAIWSQWMTGSMYLVVIAFCAWVRQNGDDDEDGIERTFIDLWERVHGAEIFHYGMLLTMYCAHNLSFTFTLPTMVLKVHKNTKESKIVPKSFLATKIANATQGIGGRNGRGKDVEKSYAETEPVELHEPPSPTAVPKSSALKQSGGSSKTVRFEGACS